MLTTECNTLLSINRDTMLMQKPNASLTANIQAKMKKEHASEKEIRKLPPSTCWFCGD